MKKLIRKIVNWAYGVDVGMELMFLRMADKNILLMMHDEVVRVASQNTVELINKTKEGKKDEKDTDTD